MRNARLYILQVLGILVLLCGYLLRDQPDRLSVMHFDLSTSNVTVVDKSTRNTTRPVAQQVVSSSHNNKDHKTNITRLFTLELMMPSVYPVFYPVIYTVKPTSVLRESYNYLFFREINPPPPRIC